jgi:hypothetical protein
MIEKRTSEAKALIHSIFYGTTKSRALIQSRFFSSLFSGALRTSIAQQPVKPCLSCTGFFLSLYVRFVYRPIRMGDACAITGALVSN